VGGSATSSSAAPASGESCRRSSVRRPLTSASCGWIDSPSARSLRTPASCLCNTSASLALSAISSKRVLLEAKSSASLARSVSRRSWNPAGSLLDIRRTWLAPCRASQDTCAQRSYRATRSMRTATRAWRFPFNVDAGLTSANENPRDLHPGVL